MKSILILILLITIVNAQSILSVDDLYVKVQQINGKVGFLSKGNYETVHHILPNNTQVEIFSHTDEIIECVKNKECTAGLISGIPDDNALNIFSSGAVSLRGMFSCKEIECRDLIIALDAAIVRVINKGYLETVAKQNTPFEFVSAHTCKSTDLSYFPFPSASNATGRLKDILTNGTFRLSALGPYDWKQDGNYQTVPYIGFWPQVMDLIWNEFIAEYGDITLVRVWEVSSQGVLDNLHSNADATEPYYTIDSFYNGRARKESFDFTCTLLGYDSKFFTLKETTTTTGDNNDQFVLGLSILGGVLGIVLLFIVYIAKRERKGKPLFRSLLVSPNNTEL